MPANPFPHTFTGWAAAAWPFAGFLWAVAAAASLVSLSGVAWLTLREAGPATPTMKAGGVTRRPISPALRYVLTLLLVSLGLVVVARGQEGRVISVRAGGVSYAGGESAALLDGAGDRRPLRIGDALGPGEAVATGAGGRAEVTLGPAARLRLDHDSEAELTDSAVGSLVLKLTNGSAILEADGSGAFSIEVVTPHAKLRLLSGGLYRVNVTPGRATEVFASSGRADVSGGGAPRQLKGGRRAVVAGGTVAVTMFDRKARDAFDRWSRGRSETVADDLRRLAAAACEGGAGVTVGGQDSFAHGYAPHLGFWSYDPTRNSYTFHLPSGGRCALPTPHLGPRGAEYGAAGQKH